MVFENRDIDEPGRITKDTATFIAELKEEIYRQVFEREMSLEDGAFIIGIKPYVLELRVKKGFGSVYRGE